MISAKIVLELRAAIPPSIPTDADEIDQTKWAPWRDQAYGALVAQAEQAAAKLGCYVAKVKPMRLEVRYDEPIGRWLLVCFELGYDG